MSESGVPKSGDCCGGAQLHAALRREFQAMLLRPGWPAPAMVQAAVTTREGPLPTQNSACGFNVGTRCGDDPALVARNRAFLRDALALPAEPCWLHQVHGVRVVVLDRPFSDPLPQAGEGDVRATPTHDFLPPRAVEEGIPGASTDKGFLPPLAGEGGRRPEGGNIALTPAAEPEADAAVTRTPGVTLAIQTADCLPVLFCADDGSEIAAAHAGWRGLSAGVLEATLAAMQTPRANILAWLGPAIAAQSYEVGEEVRAAFLAHDVRATSAFTATRPGHWLCDLYVLAHQRLRAAGVPQVFGGGLDTFTDPRLHSYRRDGARSGRMVSLIWCTPV